MLDRSASEFVTRTSPPRVYDSLGVAGLRAARPWISASELDLALNLQSRKRTLESLPRSLRLSQRLGHSPHANRAKEVRRWHEEGAEYSNGENEFGRSDEAVRERERDLDRVHEGLAGGCDSAKGDEPDDGEGLLMGASRVSFGQEQEAKG